MPDQPPPTVIATDKGTLTITPFNRAVIVRIGAEWARVTSPDDARKAAAAFLAWADTQSATAAPRSVGG